MKHYWDHTRFHNFETVSKIWNEFLVVLMNLYWEHVCNTSACQNRVRETKQQVVKKSRPFYFSQMKGSSDIFSVTKLTDALKQKFPGAQKIAVIINADYITQTKTGNGLTRPYGILINKRKMNMEEVCEILGIESLTFSLKPSQYRYIKTRSSDMFWCVVIGCEKQTKTTNEETIEYYPTTLYIIRDQSLIASFVPRAQEFNYNEFLDEE